MTRTAVVSCWFVAAALTLTFAQAGAPDADALFQAGNWAAVEPLYAARVREAPDDATAQYRLALARLKLGRPEDAIAGLRRAEELGWPAPQVAFRLACAEARLGRQDAAFEQLDRAVKGGFVQAKLLESEPELEPLRGNPKFRAVADAIDRNLHPCLHDAVFNQFDFWVGTWDVRPSNAPSAPPATNIVTKELDGCVVHEHWAGTTRGESFNVYDATEKRWHQTWVDSTGGLHQYDGQLLGSDMKFTGQVAPVPGQPRLPTRLTFYKLGPDSVRQHSESSKDGGKTWSLNYDLVYTRRQAPQQPAS